MARVILSALAKFNPFLIKNRDLTRDPVGANLPAFEDPNVFSGIVETPAVVLAALGRGPVLQIVIERPRSFDDLHVGDSIAVNGVCLTLEDFDGEAMRFALGPETLRVTGWTVQSVLGTVVNLERSLRLSDRIHGHLVLGHVDATARILNLLSQGETRQMECEAPTALRPFIWSKGSIAINGVSLTINQTSASSFSVGLIPETLRRTNLGELQIGATVNLEIDNAARGLVHWARTCNEEHAP